MENAPLEYLNRSKIKQHLEIRAQNPESNETELHSLQESGFKLCEK